MTERRYLIEAPHASLEGTLLEPDADLDGEFLFKCSFTGEIFWVRGWTVTITDITEGG